MRVRVCVSGIIVGELTFGLILTLHAYATPLATDHTLGLIMKVNNNDINRYHRNIYNTRTGQAQGLISTGFVGV